MEYIDGGDLFSYITKRGKLDEAEAFHFFHQIVLGVAYCHNLLICHRDLKPENLLVTQHGHIKIADFGLANLLSSDSLLSTKCGSPHYVGPEILTSKTYNGAKADLWSCGVILYAMLMVLQKNCYSQ